MSRQPGRIGPTARKVNIVHTPPPARLSGRLHRKAQETETVGDITSAYGAWLDRQVGALPITVKTKVVAWRDYLGALVGLVAYPAVWAVVSLSALVGVPWYLQGLLTPLAAFWAGLVPLLPATLVAGTLTGRYGWLHWHREAHRQRELDKGDTLRHHLRPRPTTKAIEDLPWRKSYLWRIPPGMTVEEYKAKAPVLRAATGKPVTITSPGEGMVKVNVHLQDLLARPVEFKAAPADAAYVVIGSDADRWEIQWELLGSSLLVAGIKGSGKSAILKAILVQLLQQGRRVSLVDLEGGPNFGRFQHLVHRCALNVPDTMTMLEELNEDRERDLLALNHPDAPDAFEDVSHVLMIDELKLLTLRKKPHAARAVELLTDMLERGRKPGFVTIAATQYPDVAVIPSDLQNEFSCTIGLRTEYRSATNTILGTGAIGDGWDLSTISPTQPGRGLWKNGERTVNFRGGGLYGDRLRAEVKALTDSRRAVADLAPVRIQAALPQVASPSSNGSHPVTDYPKPLVVESESGLSPSELKEAVAELAQLAGPIGISAPDVAKKLSVTPKRVYTACCWFRDRSRLRTDGTRWYWVEVAS